MGVLGLICNFAVIAVSLRSLGLLSPVNWRPFRIGGKTMEAAGEFAEPKG
jgi:hypothetical protein